jgi:LacI family transcriptional regulator
MLSTIRFMVSIADIARHAKVSITTVSLVLLGKGNISAATIARVKESVRKLGYRPSKLAQSLKTQVSKTVGILVPDITNPLFPQIVSVIEAEAWRKGYHTFLGNLSSADFERLCIDYLSEFFDRRVDSIVMDLDPGFDVGNRSQEHVNLMQDFIDHGTPFVIIGTTVGFDNFLEYFRVNRSRYGRLFHLLTIDRMQAARAAVRHLVQLGHRRIAFVGDCTRQDWERETGYAQKLSGYRMALEEAGLRYDPELVVNGNDNPKDGERCFEHLFLGRKLRPTAIFCTCDFLAFGVMRGAYRMRIAIPDELCVFGFDNINEAAFYNPSLSTVAQPIEEMGKEAFRRLLLVKEGGEVDPNPCVFPTELKIRESCP